MQLRLSTWANQIEPSPTLAVTAKAKALKAEGKDVCSFGAGEPDFDTPEFIKQACKDALDAGHTKYAPAAGLPALRDLLAERYRDENGLQGLSAANVVVSPGGKYSCLLAIQATVSPTEEVLIPAPYWVSYPEMVKLVGGVPVILQTTDKNSFRVTVEQLEAAVTDKTRMLILNSPSNPTGSVYTPKELEAIVDFAISRGLYILSDEIYEYLLYDGATFLSPASFSEAAARHVITVGGFSKTFSMTGWRLGTLVASEPVAKAVGSLQSQTTSNATTFAQFGALAALQQPEEAKTAVARMLEAFDRRRNLLHRGLSIDGISCYRSEGAFYLFPSIADLGVGSIDFCARLLETELVAAVPGVAFGSEGYLRLSYACSDENITKGLERLERFCKTL